VTKLACDESDGVWVEGQACDFDESLGTYRNCDCVLACPKTDIKPSEEGGCLCCPEPEPHYCLPSNTCYGCDDGFVPKTSWELGFCYCLCNKDDSVCPAGTKLNRRHGTDTYCKCDPIGGCCSEIDIDGVPSFTCQDSIKADCGGGRIWSADTCDKDPCTKTPLPTPTPEPTTVTTPAPTPTPAPTTTTTTPDPTTTTTAPPTKYVCVAPNTCGGYGEYMWTGTAWELDDNTCDPSGDCRPAPRPTQPGDFAGELKRVNCEPRAIAPDAPKVCITEEEFGRGGWVTVSGPYDTAQECDSACNL
jgi:hypothetical protein